eukprot:3731953-Prymnesium_polylepis.1
MLDPIGCCLGPAGCTARGDRRLSGERVGCELVSWSPRLPVIYAMCVRGEGQAGHVFSHLHGAWSTCRKRGWRTTKIQVSFLRTR